MRRLFLLLIILFPMLSLAFAQGDSGINMEWPPDRTVVSGRIELRGTVNPPGLQSYFVEAALMDSISGADPLWIPVSLPSLKPIIDGVIGQWDTTILPDGVYQLRLHVVLSSGESVYYTLAPIGVSNNRPVDVPGPVSVITTPGAAVLTALPSATPPPLPTSAPVPVLSNTLPLEVGGHVLYFGETTQSLMRETGLTWVKWQIPFRIGEDTTVAADRIRWSHQAGFKVLLSITGEVEELREMRDEYYPVFADFLGRIAALGPDAVEVWNEMNIDREWPQGRIDPRAYTEMLKQAHTAIKAANPAVMVITGALAPTGAEGAFGLDRVWNDDRYYLGMANAGTAAYADCIGVHYNEGILPPTSQGGDPRGEYPTRYFPLMLERVAWPFRNVAAPLCFTELGYLSPEGYGSLPGNFAWAANTSVEEQASWLVQAIQMAANYQRKPVRLLIIWNIDFDLYENDPQAGYAIIRPDGSCPACDAIRAIK